MKDYKTINKRPDINKYPIEKMDISVKGNIIYMISSEGHITFILTEEGYFYVIKKGKIKDIEGFELKSELLDDEALKLQNIKLKSKKKESQIWCNKFGTHVIIKYKSISFYYNPMMRNKISEIKLIEIGTNYVEPFAVAFNDDFFEPEDTGLILISDYDSTIYETRFLLDENKDVLVLSIGSLFKFQKEVITGKEEDDEDNDFYFFKMDEDDRILDMKLMISSNPTMGVSKTDYEEGNNIFILAITKNTFFQFYGKNTCKEVFENYKNEKVIKSYKKFISDNKGDFRHSRIQLLNEEKTAVVIFGFMTQCGYISGKFEDVINPQPQKNFSITKYYKPIIKKEEKIDPKLHIAKPVPKAVCQSKNHIFFLYHDFLVIQNKLTKRIIHYQYLPNPFLDMYYNQILNGIILYNEKGVYKIPLELEFKYLYENYIEIGNYKSALEFLSKEDTIFRPKLHKIYGDYLFEQKQFMEAAEQYAFSNEIFEHVCIKFLYTDNNLALIKYLSLIINLRMENNSKNTSSDKGKKENIDKNKNFIEKYLIITWIIELIFWKNDNINIDKFSEKFKSFIRQVNYYLDFNLLYYIINIYGKEEELLSLASLNSDYEYIILHLINQKKIEQTLELIKGFYEFGDINILKQLFFKYSNLFLKDKPSETIELLTEYFKTSSNPSDIIRMLTSPNFYELSKNEESYKILVKYVRDLSTKPIKNGNEEMNLTKNQNLHNLYVLILSLSKNDIFKGELIDYLKKPIESYEINQRFKQNLNISSNTYFDLYFAKKIFENKNEETDIKALCIILYLLKQYSESLDLAINNNFQELSKLLLNNIPEPKLKKKIWLQIFDYKKKNYSLLEAKKLIKESQGILKIEDVLPLMGDNAKISEFKDELKDCISTYEKSVQKLQKEFKDFNDSNNLINKDIDLSERKAIKMNYTRLKCFRCSKNISGEKFFMFPCRHIFDPKCLIETYKEFNKHNLGDQDFKNKVKVIRDLNRKIRELNEKKQKSIEEEQKMKEIENIGALKKMKTLLTKPINKTQFTDEEESMLKGTKKMLFDYLDTECLLCGKEMINSIQEDFGDENELGWELI